MAQMGLDVLGAAARNFPVDTVLKWLPKGWGIGMFIDVFSDDGLPVLKKFVAVKLPFVRVQLEYNKAHTLVSIPKLKKWLPAIEKIARNNPSTKVYVSHSCEYISSDAAAVKQRVDLIKQLAPSCIPVNTIWKGVGTRGVMIESHDITKRGNCKIVSTDGACITQIDAAGYVNRFNGTEICFLWADRFNLRTTDPKLPAPKLRKSVPNEEYIRGVIRMGQPKGVAPKPKFCGTVVPVEGSKKLIYKVYSEDNGGVDVRQNKPLFISPSKVKELRVVDMNGKLVTKLIYFDEYSATPGYNRHYSGLTTRKLSGRQIAERALKQSGSEFVWIHDPEMNIYYGAVHPAFRCGVYRD